MCLTFGPFFFFFFFFFIQRMIHFQVLPKCAKVLCTCKDIAKCWCYTCKSLSSIIFQAISLISSFFCLQQATMKQDVPWEKGSGEGRGENIGRKGSENNICLEAFSKKKKKKVNHAQSFECNKRNLVCLPRKGLLQVLQETGEKEMGSKGFKNLKIYRF